MNPPYYQKYLLLETNKAVVLFGNSIVYNDKRLKVSVNSKRIYQLVRNVELYSMCKGACSIYDKHFTYWPNIWRVYE